MGHTQTHMSDTVDTRRVTEFSEKSEAELHSKIDDLAEMVRAAKGSTVFFTGAGVSTAAGIADYRGPTGVWTRQRVKKLQAKTSRTAAEKGERDDIYSNDVTWMGPVWSIIMTRFHCGSPVFFLPGELELLLSEAKKKGKDGAARGGFGLQAVAQHHHRIATHHYSISVCRPCTIPVAITVPSLYAPCRRVP